MTKRKHPEDDLQRAVCQYLDARKLLWCHVPNERSNERERMKLAGLGVKPGVPDVMIFSQPYAPGDAKDWDKAGLAIELKIKPNKTTPAQDKWLADLEAEGWRTATCYDIDEVIAIVNDCYGDWP